MLLHPLNIIIKKKHVATRNSFYFECARRDLSLEEKLKVEAGTFHSTLQYMTEYSMLREKGETEATHRPEGEGSGVTEGRGQRVSVSMSARRCSLGCSI
jgi:hypothetical protein